MKDPPHHGLSVCLSLLESSGLSITEGAKALGGSPTTLSRFVNGQAGLSPDMAIHLSKAFGPVPDIWTRIQAPYELALAGVHDSSIRS